MPDRKCIFFSAQPAAFRAHCSPLIQHEIPIEDTNGHKDYLVCQIESVSGNWKDRHTCAFDVTNETTCPNFFAGAPDSKFWTDD